MSNDINQDIAKELVAQTAGKVYDDLMHPAAQATGQIISFLPRTVRVWLSKWEKWILNGEYAIKETEVLLAEKLKHIPEENLVEPEPYVAVPALQQLSYSLDSEALRELYANLLASSMNIDTKGLVHPSFVDIIKQLTPDEAKLLNYIYNQANRGIAIIDVEMRIDGGKNGVLSLLKSFSNVYDDILDDPDHYLVCIDNLLRLNLCIIPTHHYVDQTLYEPILNHPKYTQDPTVITLNKVETYNVENSDSKANLKVDKLILELTDYGKAFSNVCLTTEEFL